MILRCGGRRRARRLVAVAFLVSAGTAFAAEPAACPSAFATSGVPGVSGGTWEQRTVVVSGTDYSSGVSPVVRVSPRLFETNLPCERARNTSGCIGAVIGVVVGVVLGGMTGAAFVDRHMIAGGAFALLGMSVGGLGGGIAGWSIGHSAPDCDRVKQPEERYPYE